MKNSDSKKAKLQQEKIECQEEDRGRHGRAPRKRVGVKKGKLISPSS